MTSLSVYFPWTQLARFKINLVFHYILPKMGKITRPKVSKKLSKDLKSPKGTINAKSPVKMTEPTANPLGRVSRSQTACKRSTEDSPSGEFQPPSKKARGKSTPKLADKTVSNPSKQKAMKGANNNATVAPPAEPMTSGQSTAEPIVGTTKSLLKSIKAKRGKCVPAKTANTSPVAAERVSTGNVSTVAPDNGGVMQNDDLDDFDENDGVDISVGGSDDFTNYDGISTSESEESQ